MSGYALTKKYPLSYNAIASCKCRCGEIGRRKGLKIPRWQHRTGSSPVTGTNLRALYIKGMGFFFCCLFEIITGKIQHMRRSVLKAVFILLTIVKK